MKKIMILGAGAGQVPFIRIAKELGAEVIAVSVKGNYPGITIADKFYDIDTRDREKILEVAIEEKIDAITTDQTDVSVPTVAFVSEKMGLQSIGYERALKYTNKYLMRNAAKEACVGVPGYFRARNIKEALEGVKSLSWPLIIKPVDSSGSRGVLKINGESELISQFEESMKYSLTGDVIIEEYINGIEYIVDGFAINNKYINTDFSVKEFFHLENMCIPKMCMFSSAADIVDEIELRVLDTNKRFVDWVGLPFGITHAAYIYDPDRKDVFLVEIAARGGGDLISSDITPKVTGINTNKLLLEYLLFGKEPDIIVPRKSAGVVGCTSFGIKKGIVERIEGIEKISGFAGVDASRVLVDKGYVSHGLSDNTDKIGPILFEANSRKEGFELLNKIQDSINITLEKQRGNACIW